VTDADAPWCLVMALWGDAYGASHVNAITAAARRHDRGGLAEVVLVTDRRRADVDAAVLQVPFPAPFGEPGFFGHGYLAKLAVFSPAVLPRGRRVVYVDLDTLVIGDLGRLARRVQAPDDMFMLVSGGLKFSPPLRWLVRLTGGRRYPKGNSSVMAYHSDAVPNLADTFLALRAEYPDAPQLGIDDVFISWFGRGRTRAVPRGDAVMFRREFLSHLPGWAALTAGLPWVRARHTGLAAVTLNGTRVKAGVLAELAQGALVADGRGRRARWWPQTPGHVHARLRTAARATLPDPASAVQSRQDRSQSAAHPPGKPDQWNEKRGEP
jgi:hypothetical protein